MKIIKGDIKKINHIDGIEHSVVVIGTFDGVHTYHQKILRDAEKIAARDNLQLIVVTFDKAVKSIFTGTDEKIFTNEEKIEYINNYFAVDYYIELESNKNLISVDKMEFMNWLKEVLGTKKLVEGADFTFGSNKEGTVDDLKKYFGDKNVIVFKRRVSISSTKIHEWIASGKVDKANQHLFQPFKVLLEPGEGTVKNVVFPSIDIEQGYYDVLVNGRFPAKAILAGNQALSIVETTKPIKEDINSAVLVKFLGKILN